ncbi:MAG: sulfite exporter TauE/SafE family protein [Clostridia bacterium]|nr:sulfite exporter TauE/SafE family protein [Clostridia bacterium]
MKTQEKEENLNAKTEKKEKLSLKTKLILSLCGIAIGFINGFFGGGGGMICVPLLEKVLHLPNKYSHATAIAVIFPISFVSALIYLLSGSLETVPFLTVGSGVLLGGIVGSLLLKFLPAKVVRIIFVFVMLAGGIRLLF